MGVAKLDEAVYRPLLVAAAGMGFDAGAGYQVFIAQVLKHQRGVGVARVGLQEPIAPFEDTGRAGIAGSGQQRRPRAAVGRPPGMQALGPGPLRQVLHAAGRLAARDAQGVDEVFALQPQQTPGHHRRAEGPAGAGGVEAAPVVLLRLQRSPQPDDDVVPGHHRGDEVLARNVGQVGHREGRGEGHHTGMQRRLVVHVVHLDAVEGDAVGHGSVLGQHPMGRAHDSRRP